MKKLMIAAAIVCATVAAQAASFTWTSTGVAGTKIMYSIQDTSKTLYTVEGGITLYLFDAGITDQDKLLSALRGGEKTISDFGKTDGLAKTQTLASGSTITATAFDYGVTDGKYNFYQAIVDSEGNLFLSASAPTVTGQEGSSPNVTINGLASSTKNGVFGEDKTFATAGAGWYAVPEPTSGLLLLLGVAGLALRRRRA